MGQQLSPGIRNTHGSPVLSHRDEDDVRLRDFHALAHLPDFLSHDVARVLDREQAGTNYEILTWQRLREIADVHMPHDRVRRLLCPVAKIDLRFQQRPPRALEEAEHRRMVQMTEHIAVGRINVECHFGEPHGVQSCSKCPSKVSQKSVRRFCASAAAKALRLYVSSRRIPAAMIDVSSTFEA